MPGDPAGCIATKTVPCFRHAVVVHPHLKLSVARSRESGSGVDLRSAHPVAGDDGAADSEVTLIGLQQWRTNDLDIYLG